MAFDNAISGALTAIFGAVGVSATFTPAVGDAVTLDVNRAIETVPQGFDMTAWTTETTIEAILDDLPHEPNRGDVFTIGGIDYTVREVMENNGYTVKLVVR